LAGIRVVFFAVEIIAGVVLIRTLVVAQAASDFINSWVSKLELYHLVLAHTLYQFFR